MSQDATTYHYHTAQPSHMHEVFEAPILARLRELKPQRVLDLGCGNGSLSGMIHKAGYPVEGCDPSAEGIQRARLVHPDIPFTCMSIYDEPPAVWLEQFDVIVSTEVVEHLYDPRAMPRLAARLLKPGGAILVTTPYHGYLKNLVISLLDKWDHHLTPFWLHGHIKFWSRKTLTKLFEDEGFRLVSFCGLGRLPWLWMTMLLEFGKSEITIRIEENRLSREASECSKP
jgi:2-polyprenyl-3-methyl-5-hydroxy-6-metoxy-1,4-benzoquinol methylase